LIGGIALAVTLVATVFSYFLSREFVIRQAENKVEDLLLSQKGIHRYVQEVMHPALYKYKEEGGIGADFYAPELFSSSFIVRLEHRFYNQEREKLGEQPLYYKLASLNPRNPVNRADAREAALIKMFNEHRELKTHREVIELDGKKYLYVALPFLENTENCLKCHGQREAAPLHLQERYPGQGGFNEKPGQIRAITSIRAPLADEYQKVFVFVLALFSGLLTISGLLFFNTRLRDKVAIRTSSLAREVEERSRAEAAITAAAERFSTVLDSLDVLVYVADMESYELLFVNRYGREHWGEGIVGKICWQVMQVGQEGPCPFCTNANLLDEQGRPTGVHVWEVQNLLTNEWYECRGRAIKWIDGRLVRLEIATNISEKKRSEEEQIRLEGQLRQAQKMEAIGTLAGGIAHDFNNILTAIIGFGEIVMEQLPPGSALCVDQGHVVAAGKRAKELVKQILTFSRRSEQELQPLMVQFIVKEALKLLRSSIPASIEIRVDIDGNCGLVMADPGQIHQVVMNLCTNAYQAMRETGGVLAVSLKSVVVSAEEAKMIVNLQPGPHLCLEVADTGCGMSRAVRERIFEPYFTTKGQGEGTGLGLSLVHGIVTGLGGGINVNSAPGLGTTFKVYLPRIAVEPRAEAEVKSAIPPGGDESVLVVDDEASITGLERKLLEGLGYRVTVVAGGEQALQAFRAKPADFDLILTDMTMPGLNGDELAREILRIRPEMPIILCTGFSELIDAEKAEAMGIKEFLLKPLEKGELARAVRRALDGPESNR
jgi:signal transduction histidine kinase/ActR/RegA family two-component response regulator